MPDGFIGEACEKYLSRVCRAMSCANAVLGKNPFAGVEVSRFAPPVMSAHKSHVASYAPDTAKAGSYATGVGNQLNIVVLQGAYEQALKKVQMIDSRMAEDIYRLSVQIEEMCETIYIVPETQKKCMEYTDKMKSSLREFELLTDEAIICTRQFADRIMSLGSGGGGGGTGPAIGMAVVSDYAIGYGNSDLSVFNADSMEKIRAETEKDINDQINSIESAQAECMSQAAALEQAATSIDAQASQLDHVAATAMKLEYYTDSDGNTKSRLVPDGDAMAAAAAQAAQLRVQAADMRAQASALRSRAAELAATAGNLRQELEGANAEIRELGAEAQQADLCHADKMDAIIDDTNQYIDKMDTLGDSLDNNPSLSDPSIDTTGPAAPPPVSTDGVGVQTQAGPDNVVGLPESFNGESGTFAYIDASGPNAYAFHDQVNGVDTMGAGFSVFSGTLGFQSEYFDGNTTVDVLKADASLRYGWGDDFKGFSVNAEATTIELSSTMTLGKGIVDLNIDSSIKGPNADAFVNFVVTDKNNFSIGAGANASLIDATIGGSLFDVPTTKGGTTPLLGASFSPEGGVGAGVNVSSVNVYESKVVDVNVRTVYLGLSLGIGGDLTVTAPYVRLKPPWQW